MIPSVYLDVSIPCVDRLLGLLDRNPLSSTYGCFDRNYWHYKIVDFSNGRQQEAALTLALLYTTEHPQNVYYNQEKIKKWSLAAMQFLTAIQNSDGSFNEYYPHEHAFVTTAFAAFAASEGLLLLGERPPLIVDMLAKAGNFLMKKKELEVVNQNLGAAAALQNIYELTGDESFSRNAFSKVQASFEKQSKEGWFHEYGGPDIGYLSVAISYLGHYYAKTRDESVLSHLKKAVQFLSHFFHPDGTAGGEYGSRNTIYIVPDGIEICAQHDGYASFLADAVRTSLASTGFNPSHLDDRYLCNMLYTYIQAYKACNPHPSKKVPNPRFFSESGLLVEDLTNYHFIANLKKGGIYTLFLNGDLIASDSGFLGNLTDGTLVTSQWLGTSFLKTASGYVVTGSFVHVPEQTMTPFKTMALRASLSIGGHYASDLAKTYLRRQLITQKKCIPVSFERIITLKDGIHIKDTVKGDIPFASLYLVDHAALIYIPSSRYFHQNELRTFLTENLADVYNKEKEVTFTRDYR